MHICCKYISLNIDIFVVVYVCTEYFVINILIKLYFYATFMCTHIGLFKLIMNVAGFFSAIFWCNVPVSYWINIFMCDIHTFLSMDFVHIL